MRSTRSAAFAAAVFLLIALTGCAGQGTSPAAATSSMTPSAVASSPPSAGDDLDSITQELNGVDDSLTQAETDAAAGDAAAAQADQP
ncbi:MAG: hypothetical protein ABI053_07750 [Lacisediminihabitans sp.]